jgi:hypothetical protein
MAAMKLPNHASAILPREKIVDYLLSRHIAKGEVRRSSSHDLDSRRILGKSSQKRCGNTPPSMM